ncbi:MAG: hypothetical protein JWM47_4079, partial [Acidimicrobiales bacterium]|nr:hypothetical protein [Acidimicrobiales bacterium]
MLAAPLEDKRDVVREASHELGRPLTPLIAPVRSALRNTHSCVARDYPREVQTDLDPLNRQADRCFATRVRDSAGNDRSQGHFDA